MKITTGGLKRNEAGSSLLIYCVVLVTVVLVVGALAPLVTQTTNVTLRRSNMIQAFQYAEGGAVIACSDLNTALTNAGGLSTNLTVKGYALSSSLSTAQTNVYQRTISAPFTNQTVTAQIWLPTGASPSAAKVVATATTGPVTQTAKVNVKMTWGYPGAIISVNAGTTGTGVDKQTAQAGNVIVNGSASGPIVVDGGTGKAVLANGRVNFDYNYLNPPSSAYSMTNWSTANAIPDYTTQGTSNTLFDINRFIAVADSTPSGPSPAGNNHFTNFTSFLNAASNSTPLSPLQGVVVVDVSQTDANNGKLFPLTPTLAPHGINVEGTLIFNFTGTGWDPTTEKIIVQADMNVNPANLSGLVATNPATYTTGYPPTYTDSTKNPANINISGKGYQNFTPSDDLPAIIYTIGVLDLHGNANISGVMYTPSYMEIENKTDGNLQYIKGALIMGNGIYYENTHRSSSIISFDESSLDSLATLGNAGKKVQVVYWEP